MLLKVIYFIILTSAFLYQLVFSAEISIHNYEKETYGSFNNSYNYYVTHNIADVSHSSIYNINMKNRFPKANETHGSLPQAFENKKSIIQNKWYFKLFTNVENAPRNNNSSEDTLDSLMSHNTKQNDKQENISESQISTSRTCIPSQGQTRRRCLRKKKLTNVTNIEKIDRNLHLRNHDTFMNAKDAANTDRVFFSNPNLITHNSISFMSNTTQTSEENNGHGIPCSCYWQHPRCGCDCTGSLNYDNFMNLSAVFLPCQNFTFTMTGGHHYALPPNLFSNLKLVSNFRFFITNATFEYLCDPTPMTSPFTGVKFVHSALIRLKNVSVRRGWNWTPFGKLKGANAAHIDIVIEDSVLRRLTSDFSTIGNGMVETLDVANSKLSMIGSSAFETFINMTHFRVPDNKINSIRRSEFPKMPLKLTEIDLRNNLLRNLDEDLFSSMPSLKEISLAGNPLKVLSEKTFHDVITRVHLRGISEFSLNCDCNLKWLKNSKLSGKEMIQKNLEGATCKRPRYLRGVPFNYLSKEHLLCF